MEIVENLDTPLGNSVFSQEQSNTKNLLELFNQQKAYNSSNLFPFQLHLLSYTAGLVAGQSWCEEKIKTVEKQPIAYLYNEVQLPPLPEWDREAYPYAVIVTITYTSEYWFVPLDKARTCQDSGMMRGFAGYDQYLYNTETNAWTKSEMSNLAVPMVKWANYDVLDTFGNLYLSASEPVPVYE